MAAPAIKNWQGVVLHKLGAPVTQANVTFLNAWARAEGGGASNNPFNTTQSGFDETGNYNSVGVKNYGNPMAGINATVHTLLNGRYGNILAALHKGNDPMAAANALAASPWGTGGLVRTILGAGTPVTAPALPGGTRPVPQPSPGLTATPPANGMAPGAGLRALLSSSMADTNRLLGIPNMPLPTAFMPTPKFTTLPARAGQRVPVSTMPLPAGKFRPGIPVSNLTGKSAEHETMGLNGYPAYDYFAPSGSTAVAPISGKVIRLSGHDPSLGPVQGPHGPLGWSVYILGSDGHTYYLTHMGSRNVHVGETLKAGQPIGTVADYSKYGTPSHIHMGVN